jgi:hypothetical protein
MSEPTKDDRMKELLADLRKLLDKYQDESIPESIKSDDQIERERERDEREEMRKVSPNYIADPDWRPWHQWQD